MSEGVLQPMGVVVVRPPSLVSEHGRYLPARKRPNDLGPLLLRYAETTVLRDPRDDLRHVVLTVRLHLGEYRRHLLVDHRCRAHRRVDPTDTVQRRDQETDVKRDLPPLVRFVPDRLRFG